jgi:hypothetical protein
MRVGNHGAVLPSQLSGITMGISDKRRIMLGRRMEVSLTGSLRPSSRALP